MFFVLNLPNESILTTTSWLIISLADGSERLAESPFSQRLFNLVKAISVT